VEPLFHSHFLFSFTASFTAKPSPPSSSATVYIAMKRKGKGSAAVKKTDAEKETTNGSSPNWQDWLLVIGALAVVIAAGFLIYSIYTVSRLISQGFNGTNFISGFIDRLKDPWRHQENLRHFDRLLELLENQTLHNELVAGIDNTLFLQFLISNSLNLSEDCKGGYSRDIIVKSFYFLKQYLIMENITICFAIPPNILYRCGSDLDVTRSIHTFLDENYHRIGSSCGLAQVESFLDLPNSEATIAASTLAIDYVANHRQEMIDSNREKLCAIVDAAVESFDYWESDTKSAVCSLAQHIQCPTFPSIDIEHYCQ
jgi:hypothetical protein